MEKRGRFGGAIQSKAHCKHVWKCYNILFLSLHIYYFIFCLISICSFVNGEMFLGMDYAFNCIYPFVEKLI
jgi:hypothetical protein